MGQRRHGSAIEQMQRPIMLLDQSEIDWTGCELVERVLGMVSRRAVVKGTRILADTLVQDAALGSTLEEIQENYPDLSLGAIQCLLAFAESRLAPLAS